MLGIVTGLKAEADILRDLGMLLASGGGHQAHTRSLIEEMKRAGATHLASFGIAGALDPGLKSGDIVLASQVICPDGRVRTAEPLETAFFRKGKVWGAAKPILTAQEKYSLFHKSGALAVDTESHLVAESGLPFFVVRAIADRADQDLPKAVLNGLDENGKAQLGPILAALFLDPFQLPGLVRAGMASRIALKALLGCRGLLLAANSI